MKLLLESWRSYTTSLLNEDLLVETLQQAETSITNRATKLLKGWAWENKPEAYEFIEEKTKEDLENEWGVESFDKENNYELENYVFAWKIGGYLVSFLITEHLLPKDIEQNQKKIAALWIYKKLSEGKIISLDILFDAILKFIIKSYIRSSSKLKSTIKVQTLLDAFLSWNEVKNILHYDTDVYETDKSNLIEKFFHWNQFIPDGKRDLNSVSDYDELHELVSYALPRYNAWQEKQEQKDAEGGKEVLLDDQNWQVIAIHNKGAACQLGKGTSWCTAAPGLEYFKQYYKPNDPLFFILDKADGEKYQFHFGTQQFMDKDDNELYPSRYHVGDEIMEALAQVVPPKYDIAYKWLNKYRN